MKPKLAFFLELGGSFEEWNRVGFFSREIALYNKLAREYFGTIYVFTYGSNRDLSYSHSLEPNIIVIPRGKRSRSYPKNFFYELWLPFKHHKTLKGCDIFKTNQNSGSIAAGIAKLLFPKKKLVIRSGYIGSVLDWEKLTLVTKLYYILAENLTYRVCDHVLIPERDAKILSHKYPFVSKKITALNNAIDTSLFCKDHTRGKVYDIIYVARLTDTKNHSLLLEAVKGMNLRLLFIGIGENSEKLIEKASKHSIDVELLDSVPNNQLPKYYGAAKICAFPSLREGNPKALLEAMSCELPVVALDSPGISNIIIHGKNGLIGPDSSLQNNIIRLLNDPLLCDTLGKSARDTVLNSYSLEKIANQELHTYKQLLRPYA